MNNQINDGNSNRNNNERRSNQQQAKFLTAINFNSIRKIPSVRPTALPGYK